LYLPLRKKSIIRNREGKLWETQNKMGEDDSVMRSFWEEYLVVAGLGKISIGQCKVKDGKPCFILEKSFYVTIEKLPKFVQILYVLGKNCSSEGDEVENQDLCLCEDISISVAGTVLKYKTKEHENIICFDSLLYMSFFGTLKKVLLFSVCPNQTQYDTMVAFTDHLLGHTNQYPSKIYDSTFFKDSVTHAINLQNQSSQSQFLLRQFMYIHTNLLEGYFYVTSVLK
jgi:hypothetical protein